MTYRFDGVVTKWNTYGNKADRTYPTSITAETMDEAIEKSRAVFNEKFDDFRKFWSHSLRVETVTEIVPEETRRGEP